MKWYFRSGIIINSILLVLVQTATAALPLFSLSFIPMAINLIYTAYLFSTKRTGAADIIAISRGVVVKAIAIFVIPSLFGVDAI